MSDVTCSNHTNRGKENIALLANAWATQLPCLVREKEKVVNKPTINMVSLTI